MQRDGTVKRALEEDWGRSVSGTSKVSTMPYLLDLVRLVRQRSAGSGMRIGKPPVADVAADLAMFRPHLTAKGERADGTSERWHA